MEDVKRLKSEIISRRDEIEALLEEAYQASRIDVDSFQTWVMQKLQSQGLKADEFRVEYAEVAQQPAFRAAYPDQGSVVDPPRNVIGALNPDCPGGILLYAHADRFPRPSSMPAVKHTWTGPEAGMLHPGSRMMFPASPLCCLLLSFFRNLHPTPPCPY